MQEIAMKDRAFLDIFLVVLLIGSAVANAWDFLFRADHPVPSIVASLLALAALVVGCLHVFKKEAK
jgi:hypothetical protein